MSKVRMFLDEGFTSGKDVAERWKSQYFHCGRWDVCDGNAETIYKRILAAKNNAAKIDKAIGNDSWTKVFCSSCNEYREIGVQFGDYETKTICADCLRKAVRLIGRAEKA